MTKTADEVLHKISQTGVIAVLRGFALDDVLRIGEAFLRAQLLSWEVTVDSPGAYETIQKLVSIFGGEKGVTIGAGTVLHADAAHRAIDAGASFLFAPNLEEEVVQTAVSADRLAIPGVMTPSEMTRAYRLGAKAVKLFPASVLGADFIRQMRGPLPHIPIIPTGGIGVDDVAPYIQAGAIAVGAGGALFGDDVRAGRFDKVKIRARAYVETVSRARR